MAATQLSEVDTEKLLATLTGIKETYAVMDGEVKKNGKASSEALEKLDKLTGDVVLLQSKYDGETVKKFGDIEEKYNKLVADTKKLTVEMPKGIGQRLIEDERFKQHIASGSRDAFNAKFAGALVPSVKDITGVGLLTPQVWSGIIGLPKLPIGVRSIVPQGRTTSGAISYLRELTFTNSANVVAEGAAKPKSDKTFGEVVTPVTTIAHYFKVSKQSYDDLTGLAAIIESNGVWGVQVKEDQQLLNGNGTPPQLQGFMPIATAATAPGTGSNLVDAIGTAIFELAAKGFMPDGVVVNPANWGAVSLLKNAQGNYAFSNPIAYDSIQRIWGVRYVLTSSMTAGQFLVGAFQGNSIILDREEINVQVAAQNEDDFVKNMLTILIEERLALLIFNVNAFAKGVVPAPALAAEANAQSKK